MLPIILAIQDEDDRNYVAEIFNTYEKKLYLIAYDYLHNREDSEDCVQEVMIAVIDKLEKFRTMNLKMQKVYLETTCRRKACDVYRHNKKVRTNEVALYNYPDEKPIDIVDEEAFVDKIVISAENIELLRTLIKNLDHKYKDIFYYKYAMQMSSEEIAEICGISVENVNVRYHRARKILAKRWEDME